MRYPLIREEPNHERQPFIGQLQIQPILDGRGFRLTFSATGKDGTVFHDEESIIAPSIQGTLTLWNFNTNTPGLISHELRNTDPKHGSELSLLFGYDQPEDRNVFREEIALDCWDKNEISYTHSWGLPGGDFQERSGVRVKRTPRKDK